MTFDKKGRYVFVPVGDALHLEYVSPEISCRIQSNLRDLGRAEKAAKFLCVLLEAKIGSKFCAWTTGMEHTEEWLVGKESPENPVPLVCVLALGPWIEYETLFQEGENVVLRRYLDVEVLVNDVTNIVTQQLTTQS